MKIVKKFEDLQSDWKEVMLKETETACSFQKLYTAINLTRRYHENLLSNEEYRDHFELCKDLIQDKWVAVGKALIFDRNASASTYSLIMRNMFDWAKEDTPKKAASTPQPTPSIEDDELEKFKKKSQAQSELKVINQ